MDGEALGEQRVLGGWTLHEQLGAGGMGTVFRATRGQERAALKVVHAHLAADENFRRRFRREVQISRMVSTRYAAAVLDADLEGDQPWLASELLDGPTLSDVIREDGALAGQAVDDLLKGLAQGIADLHEAGVVHRDSKPSNVIVTARGPVLVDLGVAAAAELTSMTMTGQRLGSPGWMSPEQVDGTAVGAPTDVFAWGLVAAYALTGRNPYGTGSTDALLYRIAHHEPDLAGILATRLPVVQRALIKDPQARPTAPQLVDLVRDPSAAAELTVAMTEPADATAVETTVDGAGTQSLLAEPASRSAKRLSMTGVLVAALVVALLTAGGAVLYGWQDSANNANSRSAADVLTDTSGASTAPGRAASSTASPEPVDTAQEESVPLLQEALDPPKPRDIAKIGDFLKKNIQREVRLDLAWWPASSTPTENSLPVIWADCGTSCKAGDLAGISFSIDGLGASDNVAYASVGGERTLTGRLHVTSVVLGTGGFYEVSLRAAGFQPDPKALPVHGRCQAVDSDLLSYPGAPLSSLADGRSFNEHVLVVQDLLNAMGYGCLDETGYFDADTDQAVRAYQRDSRLAVDGIVGEQTYTHLLLTQEYDVDPDCETETPPDHCS